MRISHNSDTKITYRGSEYNQEIASILRKISDRACESLSLLPKGDPGYELTSEGLARRVFDLNAHYTLPFMLSKAVYFYPFNECLNFDWRHYIAGAYDSFKALDFAFQGKWPEASISLSRAAVHALGVVAMNNYKEFWMLEVAAIVIAPQKYRDLTKKADELICQRIYRFFNQEED
ncbi:MAG: hypothetical protein K940chlam1_00092 [Candidatus Anoxychlamydiales bacterium]|nr:hypothetical protein [Candidatus Anoxychlamydiales bacterium]NGX35554.1 hypothetical protein [Candidatus Anoxychlamydiales bacterium]